MKTPTANITLNARKLKAFTLKSRRKQNKTKKMTTSTIFIQHSLQVLARVIRQENEIKDIRNERKKKRSHHMSPSADDIIFYTENSKKFQQKD
jgi:hypothetical protein